MPSDRDIAAHAITETLNGRQSDNVRNVVFEEMRRAAQQNPGHLRDIAREFNRQSQHIAGFPRVEIGADGSINIGPLHGAGPRAPEAPQAARRGYGDPAMRPGAVRTAPVGRVEREELPPLPGTRAAEGPGVGLQQRVQAERAATRPEQTATPAEQTFPTAGQAQQRPRETRVPVVGTNVRIIQGY